MTITIPLDNLLLLTGMSIALLLSFVVEKCEEYRSVTDWIIKELSRE